MLMWIGLFILITAAAVYFRISLLFWSALVAAGLADQGFAQLVPAFNGCSGERVSHHRHIPLEQLVLQVLGAGGNNDLLPRQHGRHQISERLARASARLGDQN